MAELSALAKDLKRILRKAGQTAGDLAKRLERDTAKGLGPALAALVRGGHAVKNEDGTYSKPGK